MKTKISIIISVYNAEYYISRCLDSILSQECENIEIICVDDASEDSTRTILENYARRYKNIVLLSIHHSGAGIAKNYGLEHASGAYVFFLDADDYLILDDFYARFIELFERYDADLIKAKHKAFDYYTNKPISNAVYEMRFAEKEKYYVPLNLKDNYDELTKTPITPWCGVYKRSFIMEHHIRFDTMPYHTDLIFYENVALKSKKIYLADFYLTAHQLNAPTAMTRAGIVRREYLLKNTKWICEQMIANPSELSALVIRWRLSRVPWNAIKNEIGTDIIHKYMDGFDIRTLCHPFWFEHNIVGLLDIYGIDCLPDEYAKTEKINSLDELKKIAENSCNTLYLYTDDAVCLELDHCICMNESMLKESCLSKHTTIYISAEKDYLPELYHKIRNMGYTDLKLLPFLLR